MKTRFTILSLLFVFAIHIGLFAQSNYYILNSVGTTTDYAFDYTGNYVLQGTTAGLTDTLSYMQSIPFNFNFYGKTYTKYRVSDNGYITFDITSKISVPDNTKLPSAKAPNNCIFAFWDALLLNKPDDNYRYAILNWTYGKAPNRVHVIQWFQMHKDANTLSTYTFAIRLYESGKFDVVYNLYNPGTGAIGATTGTTGCQNEDGTLGVATTDSPVIYFPVELTAGTNNSFIVYEFIYGNQPKFDLSITSLNIPLTVKTGAPVTIAGKLRNYGSETINSMTINYSIDGGAPFTEDLTSLDIPTSSYYTFTLANKWTVPSTEKDYTIKVWTTNLNGNIDGNNTNDTLTFKVTALSNLIVRKPLHEVFTSSTCPPCKPGNETLQLVLDQYPDAWTCVKYQFYFPGTGDPYYTTEGQARADFYGGINSVPRLEIDGLWDDNPNSYTSDIFDQFAANPCYVEIKSDAVISGHSITVTGTAKSSVDISGNVKLFIAVVEKVTTQNVKNNGETEFYNVMKKMLPNADGVTVSPISKNTPININQSFTFPGEYKLPPDANSPINLATENSVEEFSDLTAVVWLQNTSTREIYQSDFSNTTINSIEVNPDNFLVNLYPNPVITSGQIRFQLENPSLVSFEIVNSIGQKVFSKSPQMMQGVQTLNFDAQTLMNGTYYMNLYIGDKLITRTFVK